MMLRKKIRWIATLSLLWFVSSPQRLISADSTAAGRDIFRHLCGKCHGKQGEGVKGKYDDALHGDWSLEKLTRYIDKNMPDDAPEKCVGADAEAVARYIYDAFYSREARARNHPARVELVRLTNRQYVNAIADLLRHFAEPDATPGQEHGLRGTYFGARGFNNQIEKRTDRQVDFDFGTNSPFPEKTGTNGFSMKWQGLLIAEESGNYEFALKTSNGTKLWLNDVDKALIDGSVSSGEFSEHKATLRLIGGRRYPLRLEFFKAPKDKTAAITLQWKPPHGAAQPIPPHNLSPDHATSTFVVATPFPPDDSSVGYERGVAVSKAWDEAVTHAAIEIANFVAKNLDRLSQSKPSDTNRAAKIQVFCREFVETAFRRPLTEPQKRVFVTSHFKSSIKPEDAARRAIMLALKSPRFLYLGLDNTKPDDFVVAERLSFGLWDSLPDAELTKLATQTALRTREQVNAQARRMLNDARARSKMRYFLHHWLQMDHVEDLSKDSKLYPGFSPEIISDLRTSLDLFLDDVVWTDTSDYRRLLLEDDLFVNNRLAEFYGINTNATDDFVKVSLDPTQRSGVITHPYLLAAFSYQKSSSPIHRGVFLTRNIVGRALKPPPMAQVFKDADFAPNLTMREKVAELTRSSACQTCHSVINPLGFSLEHYDAVGRFRTKEGDRPVDAASDYTTDDGAVVKLKGARDIAEFAAGSEHAQNAFIEQLFHQIVKQPMLAYGQDVQNRLRQSFGASDFNVQKLLVEIVAISALHGIEEKHGGDRRH
jgi:cytochrome c553